MPIIYTRKTTTQTYYVYYFEQGRYGVSVTHENGETIRFSDFSPHPQEAIAFADILCEMQMPISQLTHADRRFRSLMRLSGRPLPRR